MKRLVQVPISNCIDCPNIDHNQVDCELMDKQLPKTCNKVIPNWCPLPRIEETYK